MPSSERATEAEIHTRFAKAALGLNSGKRQFEINVPEGYDEVDLAAAFRTLGCDVTYITPKRTVIVATHDRSVR